MRKQVRLGYDEDGKPIRKWINYTNEKDFLKQKFKLQEQYKNGLRDETFIHYAEKYVEVYKKPKSPSTYYNAKLYLGKCEPLYDMNIQSITSMDCQAIINEHWDKPEVCRCVSLLLNQIFKQLIRDGKLLRNPADGLSRPKQGESENDRACTEEERERTIQFIHSDADETLRMFCGCLYYLGLRPEEVRGLYGSDFVDDNVTIRRAVAFTTNQGFEKKTKTENIRTLPVPRSILPQILDFTDGVGTSLIFTQKDGKCHSKTSYRRLWDKIRKETGVPIAYIYRKDYCTRLYYSGISIKMAAYLMGHSSAKLVLETYAKLDAKRENLDAIRNM